jgi:hypothetical protein
MYQFICPLQEKMQCSLKYDVTKPELIENKICECTVGLKAALISDMSSLQEMVASARSVGWDSNEEVHCRIL